MKYLKQFKQASEYEVFKESEDYVLPNVSYVVETKGVSYAPKKVFKLRAKYNATPDNLVAFAGASNLKSLKVNGTPIKFEPIKNEITTFDVLGENISLDMGTGAATFPESYLIKSPVSSWSFKAKDPNYVINENTYICMLRMMNGMTTASPMPFAEAMGDTFTTNDGVTLEPTNGFLYNMNMLIQSGTQISFTLCDMDTNSGMFVFIDTEYQTNVTTGGLPTYSFDSEGFYDVEIELADPVIKMQFAGTPLISIEIGNSITSIGESAFRRCSGLTSIIIPNSVTTIGNSAFNYCTGLTSITIPNSVTSIGKYTFQYCSGLTSIIIPDSVTSIGACAFDVCDDLTEVTIGSGVTTIGEYAFGSCSGLTEVTCLATTAPTIDSYTFSGINHSAVLKVPDNADYSSWMSTDKYYLGYYNWTIQYI